MWCVLLRVSEYNSGQPSGLRMRWGLRKGPSFHRGQSKLSKAVVQRQLQKGSEERESCKESQQRDDDIWTQAEDLRREAKTTETEKMLSVVSDLSQRERVEEERHLKKVKENEEL